MELTLTPNENFNPARSGFKALGSQPPGMSIFANVVYFHWMIAPGFYLVLAPAHPSPKRRAPRTRYIGPVSNRIAAELLKVSALYLGIANQAFQHN